MTTTLYTGYYALGTGSGTTFTEETGTGYARVAGSLVTASGNRHTNAAVATFTASATGWGNVTQIGMYSASSSGTRILFWNLTNPHVVGNGDSFTINALSLNLLFSDLVYRSGVLLEYATSDAMGHDAGGNVIYAGSALVIKSGVIQTTTPLLYSATGAIASSDPHVVGELWSNSGTITVSAG